MFIAALFTIAMTWKNSKCPKTDDWFKKMWQSLDIIILSEVKERQIYHLYVES